MQPISEQQRRSNLESRERWELFAPHRQRVMELVLGSRPPQGGRICLLGAGNCNDLDLAALAAAFTEVHLVDLDPQSLAEALVRQQVPQSGRFHLHGGTDLTGVADRISTWSPERPPDDAEIDRCLRQAHAADPGLPRDFDLVASLCVLTQLIEPVIFRLGEHHRRFLELLQAVRNRHLRLLAELLAPGGRGLVITDFVSSETAPELVAAHERELPLLSGRLIEARNFFHGANPFALAALFQHEPLVALAERVELLGPWRWDLGPRVYAVAAVGFQRR